MAPEFSIRSDSVDVEQIMKQIRARIRDKRGVDYTEEELAALAKVTLEKFLDPTQVRSDLLEHYRRHRDAAPVSTLLPPPENYAFEDYLVYGSARGVSGRLITTIRKILNPVLKLFINPNPIIHVLNRQSAINSHNVAQFERVEHAERVRADLAALNYEVIHNLVVEMTRLSIEVKNVKMRIESLAGRLDFNERRARSLEAVVQYKPGTGPAAEAARPPAAGASPGSAPPRAADAPGGGTIKGEAQRSRRRRRRRGRGGPAGPQAGEGLEGGSQSAGAGRGGSEIPDHGGPAVTDSSLPFEGDRASAAGGAARGSDEPTDQ